MNAVKKQTRLQILSPAWERLVKKVVCKRPISFNAYVEILTKFSPKFLVKI